MAWIRIDDGILDNPKISRAGPLGFALFVAGLTYCNRNLTDGFIPWAAAQRLISWQYLDPADEDGRERVASVARTSGLHGDDVDTGYVAMLLVNAGLWDEVLGGFEVHDYLDYQPSREDVERQRQEAAERMRRRRSPDTSNDVRSNFARSSTPPKPNPIPIGSKEPDPPSEGDAREGAHAPQAPIAMSARKAARTSPRSPARLEPMTDEQRTRLRADFGTVFPDLEERIEEALNHVARNKAKDEYLYVRGWLRRDANSLAERRNGHGQRAFPGGPGGDARTGGRGAERGRIHDPYSVEALRARGQLIEDPELPGGVADAAGAGLRAERASAGGLV